MKIHVSGGTHLAQTLARAASIRGFELTGAARKAELVFVAPDVLDHGQLGEVNQFMQEAIESTPEQTPIVLVSQVPPGYTRAWAKQHGGNLFYQVDTIIVNQALGRMVSPQQIIIGASVPDVALPLAYQEYLLQFSCPVKVMSWESAELAKMAINYHLNAQIETSRILSVVAQKVGAEYDAVRCALEGDNRIGPHAYLRPGRPNQHLLRDVNTVMALLTAEDDHDRE